MTYITLLNLNFWLNRITIEEAIQAYKEGINLYGLVAYKKGEVGMVTKAK